MFITYRRVGGSALLPALAAAGVLVIVGGIAATIAVAALAVVTVAAVGIRVSRAFGLEGFRTRGVDGNNTIEGVVVNRPSVDGQSSFTQEPEPLLLRAADPR
jgi:hypothetical protein